MSIESALADSIVAAATGLAGRIYPFSAPAGTAFPHAVFQRISTRRAHTLDGPDGLAIARVQFDIFSQTHAAARTIADAARSALDGFRGPLGAFTVQAVALENEHATHEQQTGITRIILEFVIWFEE